VDAADFKTYVFPLLFLKSISDTYDEEYQAALKESGGDVEFAQFSQNFRFTIPESAHWTDVRTVTTNVGQALQKAMRNIEKANPKTLYGIFGDAHILCSLAPESGRCAILFPHGVLFRQEETEMRGKLIEADLIECVLGLGPNLFYNSPMEACIVICRMAKPEERRGKILFINAVNEVTRERAQSFLTDDHVEHIVKAYERFEDEPGFARVATHAEIRAKGGTLSIPQYVAPATPHGTKNDTAASDGENALDIVLADWLESSRLLRQSLVDILKVKS
jgi:type I restriction enzyme M protein